MLAVRVVFCSTHPAPYPCPLLATRALEKAITLPHPHHHTPPLCRAATQLTQTREKDTPRQQPNTAHRRDSPAESSSTSQPAERASTLLLAPDTTLWAPHGRKRVPTLFQSGRVRHARGAENCVVLDLAQRPLGLEATQRHHRREPPSQNNSNDTVDAHHPQQVFGSAEGAAPRAHTLAQHTRKRYWP